METKIPFYNILNMLLTGLIFTGCCIILFNEQMILFVQSDFLQSVKSINIGMETIMTISFLAIIYEIGYIINRLGSLAETIMKRYFCVLPFDDNYRKFQEKKKDFPILSTLSREYALSRTSMVLFFITAIISCFQRYCGLAIIMFSLAILFYFSMRKHAEKILNLMK